MIRSDVMFLSHGIVHVIDVCKYDLHYVTNHPSPIIDYKYPIKSI